jgi:hypothetical protein
MLHGVLSVKIIIGSLLYREQHKREKEKESNAYVCMGFSRKMKICGKLKTIKDD